MNIYQILPKTYEVLMKELRYFVLFAKLAALFVLTVNFGMKKKVIHIQTGISN